MIRLGLVILPIRRVAKPTPKAFIKSSKFSLEIIFHVPANRSTILSVNLASKQSNDTSLHTYYYC
uniref:Uncharacterized protein n=1 Tax=Anguilla anguilla TaxID=7936 RepID=A0A0E9V1P0_ANGAN